MIKRQGVIVYLYFTIETPYVKLPSLGDVVYHSFLRCVMCTLCRWGQGRGGSLKELDEWKQWKKVLPSYYSDIDMDFVGSLERYDTSVPEPFKNFL